MGWALLVKEGRMSAVIRTLILIVVVMVNVSAYADEPGDKVKRTPDGQFEVSSVYLAPSSCYSAGPVVSGAPEGSTAIDNAILITQSLKHNGAQMCLWMMKPVEFKTTVESFKGAQAIVIYTVNDETNSVSARALAIPNP
jgi:hypothetical protein